MVTEVYRGIETSTVEISQSYVHDHPPRFSLTEKVQHPNGIGKVIRIIFDPLSSQYKYFVDGGGYFPEHRLRSVR